MNIDKIFNRLKRHTISSKLVAGVLVHNVLIIHFLKVSFHLLTMGTSERSSGYLWYKMGHSGIWMHITVFKVDFFIWNVACTFFIL